MVSKRFVTLIALKSADVVLLSQMSVQHRLLFKGDVTLFALEIGLTGSLFLCVHVDVGDVFLQVLEQVEIFLTDIAGINFLLLIHWLAVGIGMVHILQVLPQGPFMFQNLLANLALWSR